MLMYVLRFIRLGTTPNTGEYPARRNLLGNDLFRIKATSGIADNTVVLEMGAKKLQKESTAVMTIFLRSEKRL